VIVTMGWNNPDELIVANNGQVYVAPVGTPLPATASAALNGAFIGLGLISEDGAAFSRSPDVQEYRAWQRRQAVRREVTGVDTQVAFALEQWNENNVPLAFGGGDITPVSGGYRYDPPSASDGLDERSMVIDAVDGSTHLRWVIERGSATDAVETQLQRAQLALLAITFKVLAPDDEGEGWYFLTDAPGFAAGS
jgi:hypothetical protein